MKRAYVNAKIVCENNICDGILLTEDGKIKDITQRLGDEDITIIDCNGMYLAPGLCDIHVHGGGRFSAMSENADDIVNMCKAHALTGTTSIVPTTLAAPVAQLRQAMDTISEAKAKCEDVNILGIHLEGPFISMQMKGAQSPENILPATDENICALLEYSKDLLMIGAAPEIPGGMKVGEKAAALGITASVAHSNADYETVEEALKHGYSDVTHIYSACSAMHKDGLFRKVGVVEAGLSLDDFTTQFIGDLRHIPYGAIKLIYKAKGPDKAYGISDGLEYSALRMDEGSVFVQKNGMSVLYEDGVMKLADRSCLAGSTACMADILKNLIKTVGISVTDAVKMTSLTPLKVVHRDATKGRLKNGYDEDIILFDENINVKYVCVNGKQISDPALLCR